MKYHDCDTSKRCEICGDPANPHEIISRGSGGKREAWNVIYLCFKHHREYHDKGRTTWIAMYPEFEDKIVAACSRMGRIIKPTKECM